MYVQQKFRQMFRFGVVVVALAFGLSSPPSIAETSAEVSGVLEASVRDRLPADAAFKVRPAASSPLAQAMAAAFEDALRDAGYQVAPDGAYTLVFQLTGDIPQTAKRPDLELVGEGGSQNMEDVELKMRWRLQRDGNGASDKARLLLTTVNDAEGLVVWEARTTVRAADADGLMIVDALAPGIVEQLGEQVLGKALP